MKKIFFIVAILVVVFGWWYFADREPLSVEVPNDIAEHIASKYDLIRLESPKPLTVVSSPLKISGEARGQWFFEASFPIILTNWDGLIIAEGYASSVLDPNDPESTWMTTEFVPFEGEISFDKPEIIGDFARRGYLILQKSNASGLPEHDDALEVPVLFE